MSVSFLSFNFAADVLVNFVSFSMVWIAAKTTLSLLSRMINIFFDLFLSIFFNKYRKTVNTQRK